MCDIVFSILPRHLFTIAILLSKIRFNVYYIDLDYSNKLSIDEITLTSLGLFIIKSLSKISLAPFELVVNNLDFENLNNRYVTFLWAKFNTLFLSESIFYTKYLKILFLNSLVQA